MISLKVNHLLMWFVGLNLAYWSFDLLSTFSTGGGVWWSAFVSACLLVSGGLLASTVLPDAARIVRKGEVGSGEIAVIGIGLMSGGLMWSGLFSLVYNYLGRPEAWIGPMSSYGRGCVSIGMVLLFLAPEATRRGIRPPRWWIILIGVGLIALLGFYFGMTWASDTAVSGGFDTTSRPRDFTILFWRRA